MSRNFRFLFLPIALLTLGVAGCQTSTPYARMYSPRKSYYVAPPEKQGKSAEEIMKSTEAPPPGAEAGGAGLPLPPPLPSLPGELPPPGGALPPAVDPLAPATPTPPAPPL